MFSDIFWPVLSALLVCFIITEDFSFIVQYVNWKINTRRQKEYEQQLKEKGIDPEGMMGMLSGPFSENQAGSFVYPQPDGPPQTPVSGTGEYTEPEKTGQYI